MIILYKNVRLLPFFFLFCSCNGIVGAGTLGSWKPILFPVSELKLDSATSNLYKNYPEYQSPVKWQYAVEYWKNSGYDFLKAEFFYFQNPPEEMYYVSYLDSGFGVNIPNHTEIAIRSVYSEKSGWRTNDECSEEERARIIERFNNEVICKLEEYTNTHSKVED